MSVDRLLTAEAREAVAKAIATADEQNGHLPWEALLLMGKHVTEPAYDRADAAIAAVIALLGADEG